MDITATTSGTCNCNLQWERREAGGAWLSVGTGQSTITAGTGFLSSPGTYQYRALYDCGSCGIASDIIDITVFEDPSVVIDSDDTEVCLGEAVNLSAIVNGGIGSCDFQYQIRRPGDTLSLIHI